MTIVAPVGERTHLMKTFLFVLVLLLPHAASAQIFGNPSDYERVLVPILVNQPRTSAFGSRWASEFLVRNTSAQRVQLLFGPPECSITCPAPPFTYVQPMRTESESSFFFFENAASQANVGALFSVERNGASSLRFSLRILELSRQALTWGTEVPVVRESELFVAPLVLPAVPLDSRFRQTLRLYDADARGDGTVLVRFFPKNGDALLFEKRVVLEVSEPSRHRDYPRYPGYAQLADFTSLHANLKTEDSVRVEVIPLTPGLRFWAFASITHNETQHVTTVTAQ